MTVAVIAGDGIGQEVMPPAIACVDAALARHDARIDWVHYDWGTDRYKRLGRMMPVDGLETIARHEAVFFGSVGMPDVDDTVTFWGLLMPMRREFEQYVNLRPIRSLPGIPSPLVGGNEIDLVVVRENNEGEYSEIGGRAYRGFPGDMSIQANIFTRAGVERVTRYAVELARKRRKRLTSATKSNGILHTMPFWDEIVGETVQSIDPTVEVESVLIDALAAKLVLTPSRFDVIVASNLFGDILSDLAGAIAGSIGVAPSASLNPERRHPSLFEPVHGSAPDIAGKGIANPIGQIWTGALMLEHLGHQAAAADLVAAFEAVLRSGVSTSDLGGTSSTEDVGQAVVAQLQR